MDRTQLCDQLVEAGAIAVLRMDDTAPLMQVVDALRKGGVIAIEITMTMPHALHAIETVARGMGDAVVVGVGSVRDAETTRRAVDAGAQFVVSPIFKTEIIQAAHQRGVPAMPGAFTPTEIQHATEAGADVVKVFPADILGMNFFKAVLAPMPHLKLMPTGGVSLTNAGAWLQAGACAVGVGSALLDKQAIAEGNFDQLTDNARVLCRSIAAGRA